MRSMHEQRIEVRPARRSDVENMNAVKHAAIFGVGAESYPADQLSSWAGPTPRPRARGAGGRGLPELPGGHRQDVVMGYGYLDLGSGSSGDCTSGPTGAARASEGSWSRPCSRSHGTPGWTDCTSTPPPT